MELQNDSQGVNRDYFFAGSLPGAGYLHHRSQKKRLNSRLRLFGDDFAVLPDIDRRTVHKRGLARDLGGAAQRAANGGGELFATLQFVSSFRGDLSKNFGLAPELSYTLQVSAIRR